MKSEKIKYSNMDLMDKAPVTRAILQLAFPTILSNTLTIANNLVSTYYLGLMGDPFQMAAVTLALPVQLCIGAVGDIFATGTPPYMARKLGTKEYDEARRASATSFYSALILSLLMIAVYFVIRMPLLRVIGTSENTIRPTRVYMDIVAGFNFFVTLMIALSGTLRSEGATKHSMIGMGGGALLNIGLTPLFIFGFGWGIAGAAWAAVCSNAFSFFYMLQRFLRKKTVLSISPKDFRLSWTIYREILKFGMPAAVNSVLMSLTGILGNRVAAIHFGDYTVAAQGIALWVYQITYMISFGFCCGYQPFAAFNAGAKNFKRLLGAFKVSMVFCFCLGIISAILFLAVPGPIIGLFSPDAQVIAIGAKMLRAMAVSVVFLGAQNAFLYTLQGLDRPGRSMVISLGRQAIYVPLLYGLTALFGFMGFLFVYPAADLIISLVSAALTVRLLLGLADAQKEGAAPMR
jgi:putative MATE family efflux protein